MVSADSAQTPPVVARRDWLHRLHVQLNGWPYFAEGRAYCMSGAGTLPCTRHHLTVLLGCGDAWMRRGMPLALYPMPHPRASGIDVVTSVGAAWWEESVSVPIQHTPQLSWREASTDSLQHLRAS